MQVIILAGGQGLRLREETEFRPKPLVEVGGKPILWHIMRHYSAHGINQFILALGYQGDQIKRWCLEREAMVGDFICKRGQIFYFAECENELEITCADTGLNSQTGQRVCVASNHIPLRDDTFCVTYGDGVSNVDLTALLAFHKQHGRLATVTAAHPAGRFGTLNIDPDGQVFQFAEKPRGNDWINSGYFVFNRKALDYFDDGPMEVGTMNRLTKAGQLMAYRHDGFFACMDTMKDVQHLNELWNGGNPPWKVW